MYKVNYDEKYHKLGKTLWKAMKQWEQYLNGRVWFKENGIPVSEEITPAMERDMKVVVETYRAILKTMNVLEQEDRCNSFTPEQKRRWEQGEWIE